MPGSLQSLLPVCERELRLLIEDERANKAVRVACSGYIYFNGKHTGHAPLEIRRVAGDGTKQLFTAPIAEAVQRFYRFREE